jgi:hypothetical protein
LFQFGKSRNGEKQLPLSSCPQNGHNSEDLEEVSPQQCLRHTPDVHCEAVATLQAVPDGKSVVEVVVVENVVAVFVEEEDGVVRTHDPDNRYPLEQLLQSPLLLQDSHSLDAPLLLQQCLDLQGPLLHPYLLEQVAPAFF